MSADLDAALLDPSLGGDQPTTAAIDHSRIQPDLDTATPSLPPVQDAHSTRARTKAAGADVDASVVEDALSGLVSMIKPSIDDHSQPTAPSFLEQENNRLKAELAQARLTIARLQDELATGKPRPPPKVKAAPPPKTAPQRRGSIPPDDHVLEGYRREVAGWVRPVYDPTTLVHVINFAASERQETNLRVAFGSIDGHVPDEAEWKAWIAERLRLVDDILDGAKTWAQQPDHLKDLAMDVAEKRWPPLGLCDESRWKAVEFLSRRQEQRLKKPRVPKSQQKKRELSEVGPHSGPGSGGRHRSESVADSPHPNSHHINEDGDIDISEDAPISKRPRLDLLVDPALQQLLQQHAAEEEAAGRHNFVLGDAVALVAQHENNNPNGDIDIDLGNQSHADNGDPGDTTFDHLDPALHAAVSSSFADATALVEGMTALQGIEGMEGLDYELPDDLGFDSAQFSAQIESQLNEQLHSQLLEHHEPTSPNHQKKSSSTAGSGVFKGPEPGTPEADALLNANKHKSLEQFRAMGGRVLGDLCGAAGLYSRSGSIQQKAKRIYEFFQYGIGLVAPGTEHDSDGVDHRESENGRSESAELQFGPDGDLHVGSHAVKEENAEEGRDVRV